MRFLLPRENIPTHSLGPRPISAMQALGDGPPWVSICVFGSEVLDGSTGLSLACPSQAEITGPGCSGFQQHSSLISKWVAGDRAAFLPHGFPRAQREDTRWLWTPSLPHPKKSSEQAPRYRHLAEAQGHLERRSLAFQRFPRGSRAKTG